MRVIGVLAPSTGDTQAPTVPANVVATAINAGRIDLSWTASTDDFGVSGYQIFRNGSPLTTSSSTTHSDTTCQPSTQYSYVIVAFDAAGNSSASSTAAIATTPANASPVWQSIPAQSPIVGNAYLLQLSDYCSDADLDALTFSVVSGTLPSGISLATNRLQGTPTTAGQTPTITVRAADAFHQIDTTIAFHTYTADVTAPPVPTGLAATAASSSQINVSWNASTDVAGSADELVSGTKDYRVYRDGSLRTTQTGTSYSDTGLSASTQYAYRVSARDNSLNESAQATQVTATTQAAGIGFSAVSGYSASGVFDNGQSFTIHRAAGGFGAGPTILVFADFRGGTPGANVPVSQTIGAFSSMTTGGPGGEIQKPFYMTGARDGDTCMSTMTDALGAVNRYAQAIISGASPFTQFYCARAVYGDFTPNNQGNSNQKDIWVCLNGNVQGAGHDLYEGAFVGVFSNSGPIPPFYYGGSGPPCDPAFRNQSMPNGDGFYPRNEWTFNEFGVRPNTTASANALIDLFGTYCNVTYGWRRSTSTGLWRSWSSSGVTPAAWNHVYFPGDYQDRPGSQHGVSPPYLTYYKWDDLYFAVGANAWKRFLIGDASTLAACTKLYICPHTVWADGSVTFTLPHTEWPNLVGKHFFWFDNVALTATRVGVGS